MGRLALAASTAGEGEVEQGTITLPNEILPTVAIIAINSVTVCALFLLDRSPGLCAARRPLANSCRAVSILLTDGCSWRVQMFTFEQAQSNRTPALPDQ